MSARAWVISGTVGEVLAKYRRHVLQPGRLARTLGLLRGKALGCWCVPGPCHAAELAAMVNDMKR